MILLRELSLRVIVAAFSMLAASAVAATIPTETDQLVAQSDLIAIVHVPEITFGSEKISNRDTPVETVQCTAKVVEVLKGEAPKSLPITQWIRSDCDRVLLDGEWIVFLSRVEGRFLMCADPIPIKDQKASWYAAHFRWPTEEEWARIPLGTLVGPQYSKQPVAKVAEDIRSIVRRLSRR